MSTQLDAVCLALVPLFQAAIPTVRVVDGPLLSLTDENEWLFVGNDAAFAEGEGATVTQEWLVADVRSEWGEITNAIVVRSGDVDIPALRARALSILGTCETALRANRTLGGLLKDIELITHRYFPAVTSSGSKARIVFTVRYLAQL